MTPISRRLKESCINKLEVFQVVSKNTPVPVSWSEKRYFLKMNSLSVALADTESLLDIELMVTHFNKNHDSYKR